jgi:hypothetical protein
MSTSTVQRLHDRQVDVETPEHVAIGYELADLGSRFTALLIDRLILLLAQAGVILAAALIWTSAGGSGSLFSGMGLALAIAAFFVLQWGYFILYEGPSRRPDAGEALDGDPRGAGRRLPRDAGRGRRAQPDAPHRLAADAVVHRRGPGDDAPPADQAPRATWRRGRWWCATAGQRIPRKRRRPAAVQGPPRLSDKELAALSMFVERRRDLDPAVRGQLARTLVARLARPLAEDPRRSLLSAEEFLVAARDDEAARRHAAGAGGVAGSAQATALVRRQRPEWDEYARLLEGAQKDGLRKLDEATVSRFASLYRGVAADLARARTYGGSPELLYALERSVGAGHNLLYRAPSRSWQRFRAWIGGSFPALVRRLWKPILLASILFYLPAVLSFAYVRADPARARELVGPEMMARAEEAAAKEARGEGYVEVPEVMMPALASGLVSNNVQVTVPGLRGRAAGGAGDGVGAGVQRGEPGVGGRRLRQPRPEPAPVDLRPAARRGGADGHLHRRGGGAVAGLRAGAPRRMTRREALVVRGREAVSLICGTALLLLIAG